MTEVDKLSALEVGKKQEEEEEEQVLHLEQEEEYPVGNLRYFCKICSKRFMSGRALGGHMRAHGTAAMAESGEKKRMLFKSMEEDGEEEDELNGVGDQLYTLRRNPKRSWRFSDQEYPFMMGTHTQSQEEEEEGFTETESEAEIEQHPNEDSRSFERWMKGKRSRRPRYAIQTQSQSHHEELSLSHHEEQFSSDTNEEEDMALCLVMLASGVNNATQKLQVHGGEKQPGDLKVPKISNALVELPKCIKRRPKTKMLDANVDPSDDKKIRYECTTCNKTFHSYQALGGHRASHKKVKGCFSRIDGMEENESLEEEITDEERISRSADSQLPNDFRKPSVKEHTKHGFDDAREESGETTLQPGISSSLKKARIHECSICHRTFPSGQALGGHKRCHWGSAGNSDTISTVSSTKEQQQRPMRPEMLDLNLPAPVDDDSEARQSNVLGVNVKNSHKPSNAENRSKMNPPFFQSWWLGTYPKQGQFLYNNQALLSIEDEADSKLGKKIDFGGVEDLKVSSRLQPWLQL